MVKHLLLILVVSCSILPQLRAQDTLLLPVNHQLQYFNSAQQQYQPLADKEAEVTTASIEMKRAMYTYEWLQINGKQGTTVLIDQAIVTQIDNKGEVNIALGELPVGSRVELYHPDGTEGLAVSLVKIGKAEPSVDSTIETKAAKIYNEVMTLALLVILCLFTVIRVYHAEVFSSFFYWSRSLSLRTIKEPLYKTRIMESGNLLMLLAFSCLISLSFITVIFLRGYAPVFGNWFVFNSTWQGVLYWLAFSAILFLGFILKRAWIALFCEIYAFKNFGRIHFYNYVRVSGLVYIIFIVLSVLQIFSLPPFAIATILVVVLASLLALRVGTVFIKLLNISTHKKLHLFSYLCATELIPYMVLVKIIFL